MSYRILLKNSPCSTYLEVSQESWVEMLRIIYLLQCCFTDNYCWMAVSNYYSSLRSWRFSVRLINMNAVKQRKQAVELGVEKPPTGI